MDASKLKEACLLLTEASILIQKAGFGEHSYPVRGVREINGTLLIQIEVIESRQGQAKAIANKDATPA